MFRRDIEGLRAIAVALVVLHHAHVPGFGGGYIGVDVFFVVSGFLITGLLLRERENTGRISIPGFYARRARRILPAVTLVIVATVLASRVWLEPLRARTIGSDAIGGGGFFANMVFAARSTDYFQSAAPPSPLQHLWSLSVEEQFYVVWPLLLLLLLRGRARRAPATAVIAVLSVSSLVACVVITDRSPPWAFFGAHTRAWELGTGALLALGWSRVESLPVALRNTAGWAGVGAIAAAGVLITPTTPCPGWVAAVPVLATAAAITGGTTTRFSPVGLLGTRPMQWIGARSYSIYLWHWPALVIAEGRAGRPLNAAERLGAVTFALLAAEVSFRLIENPIRHARVFNERTSPALWLGAGLVASSVVTGAVIRTESRVLATDTIAAPPTLIPTSAPPDGERPGTALDDTPGAQGEPVPASTARSEQARSSSTLGPTTTTGPAVSDRVIQPVGFPALADALNTTAVPKNLEPSLERAAGNRPLTYRNGCHRSPRGRWPLLCEYGDTESDFTIALFGDSHAAQWFDAFDAIAKTNGWRMLSITKAVCPIFDEATYFAPAGPVYTACTDWRRAALRMMQRQKVRVVFMANSYHVLDDTTRKPFPARTTGRALDRLIEDLTAHSITPVLLTDTAYARQNVPNCLSESLREVERCVTTRTEAVRQDQIDAVVNAAKRNNVQYLDVQPWVCTEQACPVIIGNILMYRDSDHLTTDYVRFLTPLLEASLAPYVNGVRARG